MAAEDTRPSSFTRRGFLKGALTGVGALTLSERLAFAHTLLSENEPLTAANIRGFGVEPGVVAINSNENPFGPSPAAIQAVARHLHDMNRYDWQAPSMLAKKIAAHLGLPEPQSDWSGTPFQIEGGSGFILRQVALALGIGDGNGEVVEAEPAYGSVSQTFLSHRERFGSNATAIRVPTDEDYVHDLDAMRRAITPKTTLVVITNPNNPSGTIVPHDDLARFVDDVPENVLILIDEAYIHFVREPDYRDAIRLAQTHPNVLVARTFSKMYGLAGLRVGYVFGNEKLIDRLRFFGNSSGVSKLSCYAAAAALEDQGFVHRVKRSTDEGKDYLYQELDQMGLRYIPSHSSFVLVDLERDAVEIQERLAEQNILLGRYGLGNNPAFSTLIRISIGTSEELEVAIEGLKKELSA